MENKVLELLLDMQKDIKDIKANVKELNIRVDKLEYRVADGFETLEILNNNTSHKMSVFTYLIVNIKQTKREGRAIPTV